MLFDIKSECVSNTKGVTSRTFNKQHKKYKFTRLSFIMDFHLFFFFLKMNFSSFFQCCCLGKYIHTNTMPSFILCEFFLNDFALWCENIMKSLNTLLYSFLFRFFLMRYFHIDGNFLHFLKSNKRKIPLGNDIQYTFWFLIICAEYIFMFFLWNLWGEWDVLWITKNYSNVDNADLSQLIMLSYTSLTLSNYYCVILSFSLIFLRVKPTLNTSTKKSVLVSTLT